MPSSKDFHGRWALVTGASAGIGVALARELAGHGARLILSARRADRLEALAGELRGQGCEVRIVPADLNDPAAPQAIYDATEGAGIEVDLLINNAGLGIFGEFHTNSIDQELSQVRVNCHAMVHLTRLFLPRMVARRRGWVLITASNASYQPVPFLSTYAATKAFDRMFALGIAQEVARYGINVTSLCPGPTESEFFDVAGAGVFRKRGVQSAQEVARIGIQALAQGRRNVLPNLGIRVAAFAVRFLPTRLITAVVDKATRSSLKKG